MITCVQTVTTLKLSADLRRERQIFPSQAEMYLPEPSHTKLNGSCRLYGGDELSPVHFEPTTLAARQRVN